MVASLARLVVNAPQGVALASENNSAPASMTCFGNLRAAGPSRNAAGCPFTCNFSDGKCGGPTRVERLAACFLQKRVCSFLSRDVSQIVRPISFSQSGARD